MNKIKQACLIAKRDLRACYSGEGIKTGSTRDTFWSWDSFFASLGSIALGDYEIVSKNLTLYLGNMKEGIIPRRISSPFLFYHLNFLTSRFHNLKKQPSFSVFKGYPVGPFQNIVFVISLANYTRSGDKGLLRENYSKIKEVSDAIKRFERHGMIHEKYMQNWSETLLKRGFVLFTNVLYFRSLEDMAYLSHVAGDEKYSRTSKERSKHLKALINKTFWKGDYYADWISGNRVFSNLSTDGNAAAILYGVADIYKAKKILDAFDKYATAKLPSITNAPRYPDTLVLPINWIVNRGYHNGCSWLWLGCFEALANNRVGRKRRAVEILEKIAELIVRDGTVIEIYNPDGRPINSLVYKSEKQFAWSAGVFLWAVKTVFQKFY